MKLTVQDISNFPELSKLTLIAGREGLKKAVTHCGILDYEYDRDVSSKYYDYNYQVDGGFLTLTTFLYAKHDPNLIYDAVKKLVSKNGSGLIIKNIFKLPIRENVIRYADHMKFPIFILNDSYPFFEDILLSVNKAIEKYDSIYFMEQKVKSLFDIKESDIEAITKGVKEINPFMQENILCVYCKYKHGRMSTELYLDIENKIYESGLAQSEDSVFLYENGFLFIHSSRYFEEPSARDIMTPFLDFMNDHGFADDFLLGASKLHYNKEDLIHAIKESIYAARFSNESEGSSIFFDDLGPYQAVIPYAKTNSMFNYSRQYIDPLAAYDTAKNGSLLDTLTEFVKCGGDLEKTAEKMGQHKNTIRYRLKKTGEILNLNPFALGDYETIALAIRIGICSGEL